MNQNRLTREKAYEMIRKIQERVSQIDFIQYMDGDLSEEEETEPVPELSGISNGFLAELIHLFTGYEVEVYGEVEVRYPCPCCGFRTLTESYDPEEGTGYEVCPYCKWEDDGTVDIEAYRSINRGSISDYRKRMQRESNRYYIEKWMR